MKLRAIEDTQTINTQTTNNSGSAPNETAIAAKFEAKFPADIDTLNSKYKSGVVMVCQNITNRSYDNFIDLRDAYARKDTKAATNVDTLGVVLLPQSQVRVENNQHNYEEDNESLITYSSEKGWKAGILQGTVGFIEKIVGTTLQDQTGEVLDRRRKSYYQGSAPREYLYMNTFTFQSDKDLQAFAQIYKVFTKFGYPSHGQKLQQTIKDIGNSVQQGTDSLGNKFNVESLGDKLLIPDLVTALSDFNTRKLPPIWFIKPFEYSKNADGSFSNISRILPQTTYGPMALVSVRFDMTPDSIPKYFALYPNDPVNVTIELRFKEMFEMKQEMIFDEDFIEFRNRTKDKGSDIA